MIDDLVLEDRQQPGPHRGGPFVPPSRLEGRDERVLHEVLRQLATSHADSRVPVERIAVLVEPGGGFLAERGRARIAGLGDSVCGHGPSISRIGADRHGAADPGRPGPMSHRAAHRQARNRDLEAPQLEGGIGTVVRFVADDPTRNHEPGADSDAQPDPIGAHVPPRRRDARDRGGRRAAADARPPALSPALKESLDRISADSLRGHLSFLASDLLEGRGTPSKGLDLAAEYIAAQFRRAGLEPIGDDGYFQTADWKYLAPDPDTFACRWKLADQAIPIDADHASGSLEAALDLPPTLDDQGQRLERRRSQGARARPGEGEGRAGRRSPTPTRRIARGPAR